MLHYEISDPFREASDMDQKFLTPFREPSDMDQKFLTPFREASDMDQKFLTPFREASDMDQKFLTPCLTERDQKFLTPFREASDMDQKFLTPTNMYNNIIILLSVFNYCNFVIQSFMFSSISSRQKLDISLNLSDFNLETRKKLLF